MNIIDPLNMHFVCGSDKAVPLATDGISTPALVITNTLWRELEYLTKTVFKDIEYAVFLTLDRPSATKQLWLATGFFMPKQEITQTHIDTDLDDVRKFVAEGKWHHKFLCHWHSHNHMAAFWSGTDITAQTDRSELAYADNYRFYVVVNDKDNYKCDCVTYDPFLMRTEGIPIYTTGAGENFDNELTKSRKEELEKLAKEKCTRETTPILSIAQPEDITDDHRTWYDSGLDEELKQLEEDKHGNYGFDVAKHAPYFSAFY